MTYEINAIEYNLCKEWIKANLVPRNTMNHRYSSYYYKHCVESDTGTYVSNEAFIKAAIDLGLKYKVSGPNILLAVKPLTDRDGVGNKYED